jgi:predicted permease
MKEFFRRLHYLVNRRRLDQELANDMEFHREMAAREGGRHFGNTLRLREEARDAWGWTWIDRFLQDLRYAARMLQKSLGFTVVAVLMLAIGIGVNIAAFGFFNLMVLRPLPVRDPNTLLRFKRLAPESFSYDLPYPEMAFFREYGKTLSAVLALNSTKLSIEGEQKQLNAHFVTANLFGELGASAGLGRMLDPERDEASNAEPVVVLGHGFWQRHFGADPSIVGKTILLNNRPVTVVGVAPSEFSGLSLDKPDLWAPITQQPYFVTGSQLLTDFSEDGSGVRMFGRLQPGLTPKVAEDELRSLAAQLRRQHPADIWENESLPSEPGGYAKNVTGDRHGTGRETRDDAYPAVALAGTLVLLILAVACGNLGSLLLARGVAREREITIRVAVGADRGRLIRQLFTESLLLALLGSVAGLVLGYFVLRGLMVLTETPAWLNAAPDWRVIVFAIGTGFAAAILFGLTPALQIARQRHRTTLLRQFLVGAQVAGSCVLLIVAGLLVRALHHAVSTPPGFEYDQVVSIDPVLFMHGYSSPNARAYLDVLQSRLRDLPGVEAVSMASAAPLSKKNVIMNIGQLDRRVGRAVDIHINRVDPPFFQTMKIPLLRGRNLMRSDTHAIIISESLARLQWPTEDPIGKPFRMGEDSVGAGIDYTVVGVSGNERLIALENSDAVELYQLADVDDPPSMVVLVKTSGPPEGLISSVASIAKAIDPKVFPEVQLMKSSYRRKLQSAEYGALCVSLLGFVALMLACLGIVGLVACSVSQRTKEIGIRIALGANSSHVLSAVLGQLSRPVVVGLLVGAGGAAAISHVLRLILYGISNLDPIAYLAAIGIFVVSVALAALLPARRALRVDPMLALRYE